MTEFNRKAGALWTGNLKNGDGLISTESKTLYQLPYSFQTRFGEKEGSNPEELIAAAHAACFSMALAGTLEKNGFTPVQTETTATCTVASKNEGFEINHILLHVRCQIPDIDESTFNKLVMEANKGCPVSNLLRDGLNIEITTDLINTVPQK